LKTIVNGIEVHYVDVNDSHALPIVLIHGFPFNHEMWQPQIESFAKKFRVIAYDIRGHGKTVAPDSQYVIEFLVDDLISLLDYLKIEKAILCGLSLGGYIALRTVERNPERVLALILADTQSKPDSNEAKLKRAATMKSIKTQGIHAYAENLVKTLFTSDTLTKKTDLVAWVKEMIKASSPSAICAALLALTGRTDTTPTLPNINVPTLILVGEHDASTTPIASQEMHNKIVNSEIHVIPNAGHLSNLENPGEFNKHILNFLAKLET
jgi:3-oxoadipate enol-lactonase